MSSSSSSSPAADTSAPAEVVCEPLRSAEDQREHRVVRLANGLVALLVSDPETDKAAAAMDVRVGNWSDPDELPGLAHAVEHVLFLGTKKFPGLNDYAAFLNAHGGSSNAYTASENTNYHFDVVAAHLEGALDRFSQFFIAPLFDESATDRELTAVDNEFAKNLQNDPWRSFGLLRATSDRSHPFGGRFGSGNLLSLRDRPAEKGIDVRAAFLAFHKEYYSASTARLCIVGREPLDTLQEWARRYFTGMPNTGRERPVHSGSPFGPAQRARLYRVVPVKDHRQLEVLFPTPACEEHYRSRPQGMVSHLIGHEGKGSLLSLLRARGWANELSAGLYFGSATFSAFVVSLDLTEKGLEVWEDVLAAVFAYVRLLHGAGDEVWQRTHEELRDVAAMNFRYKSKETPYNYASGMAGALQVRAPEDVLSGAYLRTEYRPDLVRDFVRCLVPEACRVHLTSRSFESAEGNKTEEWYGTAYSEEPLGDALVARLAAAEEAADALALPPPNEFIASDFSLRGDGEAERERLLREGTPAPDADGIPPQGEPPSVVADWDALQCWHKRDDRFYKPKLNVVFSITSPAAASSPEASVLTDLYTRMLEDSLAEYAYDAECAGLSYSFYPTTSGLKLVVKGYNHKLPVLFSRVLERVFALKLSPERFKVLREQQERGYRNWFMEQPYQHAIFHHQMCTEPGRWAVGEKLAACEAATLEGLERHVGRLLARVHGLMLVHGNADEADALALAGSARELLERHSAALPEAERPDQRLTNLVPGARYVHETSVENAEDTNSAVQLSFQVGERTIENAALVTIVAHLMREECFNQLRTVEQLGYLVFSGHMRQRGVLALRVILQSGDKPADYLEGRAEAFLAQFGEWLAELRPEVWQRNMDAVVAQVLEKDKTLTQTTNRLWAEIAIRKQVFDRRPRMVRALRALKLEQAVAFFKRHVAADSPERRLLAARLYGCGTGFKAGEGDAPPFESGYVLPEGEQAKTAKAGAAAAAAKAAGGGDAAADDKAEAADEDKADEPPKALRAPPVETRPVNVIRDFAQFRWSMPLYPQFE